MRASASWVIREKATGAVIAETFERRTIDNLPPAYEAIPIYEYLTQLNRKIKADEKPRA